jgi:HipA-like kinase
MSEMRTFQAKRVVARIRSGSSSPVVVETEAGPFVAKLRGAGHGLLALTAEIIVAELAELLGLPVPERVLLTLSEDVPSDDRNDELADLLRASAGQNLGFRRLEGAREPGPKELEALDDEFAARVLWLDGLTMNPDRTAKNPNILIWKGRPWLIDHGSALTFHHDWAEVSEDSPREAFAYGGHVFEPRLPLLERWDAELARVVSSPALEAAIARVPDAFLILNELDTSRARLRAAYHAFLWKRLKTPRPFVQFR